MKNIIVCLICFYSVFTYGQVIDEPYGFPVNPGTEEWSKLKTEKERYSAMQIPEETLHNLSTNAIVISCINFPAFGFFGAYNNYQDGFIIMATKFNGLQELAKRKDAGECLINIYERSKENGIEIQKYIVDNKYWPIRLSWIELIMSQKLIIESLTIDEKKHLLSLSLEKFYMKQLNNLDFSDGLVTTALLMGRILHSINFYEFESEYNRNGVLRNFLTSSSLSDITTIELISKQTQKYLNM